MTAAARKEGAAGRDRAACAIDLATGMRQPPGAVHALLSDIQDGEPIPRRAGARVIKDPAGPAAAGTQWHEHVRLAPGCRLHIDSVVTEVGEPRRLGMDFHNLWFTGHLTCETGRTKDGSVLHHREALRPRLPLRPFAPFIEQAPRPQLERRLADIRQLLERSRHSRQLHHAQTRPVTSQRSCAPQRRDCGTARRSGPDYLPARDAIRGAMTRPHERSACHTGTNQRPGLKLVVGDPAFCRFALLSRMVMKASAGHDASAVLGGCHQRE